MASKEEWFGSWFDSPFYHQLYNNRDQAEADHFINNLIGYLKPAQNSSFLDLACGKGRHSLFINSLGYDVVGVDLSPKSILEAKKSENKTLKFFVHDMRQPIPSNQFNFVLNLFTSFGYFEHQKDNIDVLCTMSSALKPNGVIVIDFLNAIRVKKLLVPKESLKKSGITFEITRKIEDERIYKDIRFTAQSKKYNFQERVQALGLTHFQELCKLTGLKIKNTFGNYDLEEFHENSERLILVIEKQ